MTQALDLPGVDGLTLLLGRMDLEPSRGDFYRANLDQWMTTPSRKASTTLTIRAGYRGRSDKPAR